MDHREQTLEYLRALGIPYRLREHPPATTYEQNMANAAPFGVPLAFCKNLLLTTRRKTAFYLLLLPYCKRFQTAQAAKAIGSPRLSLAPDPLLLQYLGCTPGSASGLGLLFDREHKVSLVADKELLVPPYLCFHPCDNRYTVCMERDAFFHTFAQATGHPPQFVALAEHHDNP